MSPIEASSLFATLVGLICNWKQERAGSSSDNFQNFLTWLSNHNFQQLRTLILESSDVQRELNELLREDSEILSQKLDLICTSLSAISDRIEGLASLSRALRTPTEALSNQAADVLKIFDQYGDERMILFASRQPPAIGFLPSGRSITVGDSRFLEDDVASLVTLGLITLVKHNNSGDPIFALTRPGARFASQLPPVQVGSGAT